MGVHNATDRFLPREHPAAPHAQLVQNLSGALADDLIVVHHQHRQSGKLLIVLFGFLAQFE